jgi:hypothetical protein
MAAAARHSLGLGGPRRVRYRAPVFCEASRQAVCEPDIQVPFAVGKDKATVGVARRCRRERHVAKILSLEHGDPIRLPENCHDLLRGHSAAAYCCRRRSPFADADRCSRDQANPSRVGMALGTGDRWFESRSLQRRVTREPHLGRCRSGVTSAQRRNPSISARTRPIAKPRRARRCRGIVDTRGFVFHYGWERIAGGGGPCPRSLGIVMLDHTAGAAVRQPCSSS